MSDEGEKKGGIRWEKPKPAAKEDPPERTPERKGKPAFPEAPGTASKPGDPPLEQPFGDRSRHGGLDDDGERGR